jgi:DHA2 family multidrug resistance protein
MVVFALWLDTGFDLQMGNDLIIVAGLIEGAGSGLVMTVLGYVAVSSAPVHLRTEASAVFALVRNTGLSIAIAVFSALLVYNTQVNHAELGSVLSRGIARLPEMLGQGPAGARAASIANAEVTRQAMMIAYINDFWLMMWALVLMLPVVLMLAPVRAPRGGDAEPIMVGE